jgi:hypothetical protein
MTRKANWRETDSTLSAKKRYSQKWKSLVDNLVLVTGRLHKASTAVPLSYGTKPSDSQLVERFSGFGTEYE